MGRKKKSIKRSTKKDNKVASPEENVKAIKKLKKDTKFEPVNKEIDGDSGKPIDELPPLTISDQDDREYWNQERVLQSTGNNTKIEYSGIIEWFEKTVIKYNIPKDANILIIGCGPGRIAKGIRQLFKQYDNSGWKMTCYEGSAGMVERARKNVEDKHPDANPKDKWPSIEIHHKNAMDIEDVEKFDLIWTCTVLQHNSMKNKTVMLPRMQRALKKGGYYVCLEGIKRESTWVWPTKDYPEGQFKFYKEEGKFTYDWADKKGAKGTAAWWINIIGKHGMEIQELGSHHMDWFVFRKINEKGSHLN